MHAGTLVALVTIPSNFDAALQAGHPVAVPMVLNNLDEDLTDDAQRGMGLSVTLFYSREFPSQAPIITVEHDRYAEDTGYIPFLAISIIVISLLVTGLLEGGMSAAREFEYGTIQVWKLSPAPDWVIQLGLMASSAVMSLPAVVIVLAVVVSISGWPTNPLMVLLTSMLALLCFVAAGTALGTALKERGALTIFARGLAVPLFFLSGVFGAISFNTPAVMWIARVFPVHYTIVLLQAGWRGFITTTLPPIANAAIITGFAVLFILLSQLALRVSRVTHV